MESSPQVLIRDDLRPGDIGAIIHLHGMLYAREYGWDPTFEAYVAEGLARFVLEPDTEHARIWIAESASGPAGCIAIAAGPDDTAQLRWFLVHPDCRGAGLGRRLMEQALEFCRAWRFRAVFLWTVADLRAAAHLYRSYGFSVTEEYEHERWGDIVMEQRYELSL